MNKTPRLSKSAIEYLDYVWNFASGCTKGCSYCYAKKIATRFPGHYPNGFEPMLYPEAFCSPMRLKKPSIIGVGYMGDLFDDAIDPAAKVEALLPSEQFSVSMSLKGWIETTIKECPQHRFLFLTKQPRNLEKWAPFPDNCWVGVSATDRDSFNDAIWYLKDVEASVRYISFEPLLADPVVGILDNRRYQWPVMHGSIVENVLDWIIIGAQTKPTVQPDIEWVRQIVAAADAAGIPVFLKDSLKPLIGVYPEIVRPKGVKITLPGELRQEMPK
ncbi:hypothetical protein LCGC14_2145590 [marine sediment metagenome]|uniref:Radical SAM core domain-containing protein n=1 Tax=marine sediment metagenome TaxID=412755 RepID=A0A0F9DXC2_9ZZZZ